MKHYFILILVICLFLSGCNIVKNAEKVKIDESDNRILVEDENKGSTWVTLQANDKIKNYEDGQEVAFWLDGGIDTSLPAYTKALNIER